MIFFQFFGLLNLLGLSKETSIAYFQTAFYLLVYGLYFGVLGRDLVTVLADTMASTIGVSYYQSPTKFNQFRIYVISLYSTTVKTVCQKNISGRIFALFAATKS
jgi:hypothetical protein